MAKKRYVRVQFSGDAEVDRKVREVAEKNNVTINEMYRYLIKTAVNVGALEREYTPLGAGIPPVVAE